MDDLTRAAIDMERRRLRRELSAEIKALHGEVHNLTDDHDMTAALHNLTTTVTGAAIIAARLAALRAITPEETDPS
ncbi:MAG: hypothetical protein ABW022_20245 [Actinoplanes sp.]